RSAWSLWSRSSAHRLLDEVGDFLLVCLRQPRQGVRRRPHRAVVEVRLVVEAEGRVAILELAGVLEEADHLVVLRVGRHSVPRAWGELRCDLANNGVDPLRDLPVGVGHLRDRRKNCLLTLAVLQCRLRCGLLLGGELPCHQTPFVRSTTWANRSSRCSQLLMPSNAYGASMQRRARPIFSVVTSSASSSRRMCFFIPVSVI